MVKGCKRSTAKVKMGKLIVINQYVRSNFILCKILADVKISLWFFGLK